MSPQNLKTLLDFFKALSNESRLKLLGVLAQRECSVEELAALLDLKPPTVSHHLAKLKALNLVSLSPQGNTHLYRLNLEQLQHLSRDLLTPEQMQTLAQDVEPKNWETTVLQSFIAGDRITSIPVSRKKRFVLLKWLVEKFECDRDYSEKEVNSILKRHHEDCATLRREFIGYQMMKRDRDVYRRLPETEWLSEDGNFN
ncbi:MAG TPA: ArsR family transcriptional regulator [Cyanobacteria bacterium UBA11149]|nr:ArsR family transcriptional regulator [Cyanobacteria bacterium UBA11366]HBR77228.1 ArsR family transcriptional regulator [Cyanobacteria bacterium UBA11159]HBS72254.1 ArsR family transcriptional regulator [Cyanobacteria bacterium UBA11153]HBW87652.1 ArsR family transcriptional regulator [Cyanobacteria bacterium UBA11149]HCA96664.1 ArsR family transcriptional regulator [Cyanobacteria bacterium UBA9226]